MGTQRADAYVKKPGGTKEVNEEHRRARQARDHRADRRHHHHVGAGRELPQAVEVQQFRKRYPVIGIDRERLELGKRRNAAADSEQREVGEDPRDVAELLHLLPCLWPRFPRWRCHQMATAPATTRAEGTWMPKPPTAAAV